MTGTIRRLTIGAVVLASVASLLGAGASASSTGTVPTVITIQQPQINAAAGTAVLRGVLYRKGQPSARIRTGVVYLQRMRPTSRVWTNVAVTRTSSTGSYAFTVGLPEPFVYRARFAGSPTYAPATSGAAWVPGRFRMWVTSFTQTDVDYHADPGAAPGSWLTATGRISPALRITNAWITRYNDAKRTWEQPADWKFSISGDRFTVTSTAKLGAGKFRLEFELAGGGFWYGTTSAVYQRTIHRVVDLNDLRTQSGTSNGGMGWYGYEAFDYQLRPLVVKLPPGESAWTVAYVAGCVRLAGVVREDRSPHMRFSIQTNAATLQTTDLTSANARTAWSGLNLSGVTAIRITMTNLDSSSPSWGSFLADVTCAR